MHPLRKRVVLGVFTLLMTTSLAARSAEPASSANREDAGGEAVFGFSFNFDFPDFGPSAIGVTRLGTVMEVASIHAPYEDPRPRIVFLFQRMDEKEIDAFIESIIDEKSILWGAVVLNPDGKPGSEQNGSGGDPSRGYPPVGGYYDDPKTPESRYLWRWLGVHAPDLVVEVVPGKGESWYAPKSEMSQLAELVKHLPGVNPLADSDELVAQLVKAAPCNTGPIPALRVVTNDNKYVARILEAVAKSKLPRSPAHVEILSRLQRTPEQIAEQILEFYGKQLSAVQYIPALALVGRLRHERHTQGAEVAISPVVLKAVDAYVTGAKPALDAKANGSTFSGHLIFAELAERTGDAKYTALVKAVGDRAFDAQGKPLPSMPSHNEMSDAVFMAGPILAYAGKLTGDAKYYDASVRNMKFMQQLCLRKDGIYRHSPLDEAAWGRGNGFPALGLTWTLDALPESYAGRSEVSAALEKHLRALLEHQDPSGMWHQVIDKPESYAEFTATAMIAYAMTRGVRQGRLDAKTFAKPIEKAWYALRTRIAADGTLVDVCTGTGKQKSLRDYYDRPAILGRDDRGGAMALMIATEMERYLAEQRK